MHQSRQRWLTIYIIAVLGVALLVLHLIRINSDSDTAVLEIGHKNQQRRGTCESCSIFESDPDLYNDCENGKFVPVSLSDIVSGKPYVLPQDDQRIIDYIWSKGHIQPPSEHDYNLEHPESDPSMGQSQYIRKVFKNMKNGFFIECGALDGETRSNTLFMENNLNWKGLLIEGDPSNFAMLQKKNRKAWIANTCVAVKPYPHMAIFHQEFNLGKIVSTDENIAEAPKNVSVQCMPLYSLMMAINVTTVDYFSLDVEGSELQVLKTIPFDKVFVRTISVEFVHIKEGKSELLKFMESKGFRLNNDVPHTPGLVNDYIFTHKDAKIGIRS